jgi:hypothetical protein
MKHLLTGVAMAAALAIAAPVWAQTTPSPAPMTPPASGAPSTPTATKPMTPKPMMHRHMVMHHKGMMSSGDQMTDQLNQQELARIQGGNTGSMPAPAPGGPSPGMSAPPPPK